MLLVTTRMLHLQCLDFGDTLEYLSIGFQEHEKHVPGSDDNHFSSVIQDQPKRFLLLNVTISYGKLEQISRIKCCSNWSCSYLFLCNLKILLFLYWHLVSLLQTHSFIFKRAFLASAAKAAVSKCMNNIFNRCILLPLVSKWISRFHLWLPKKPTVGM